MYEKSIKTATWIIAFATIANVVVAIFMWQTNSKIINATEKQVELSRKIIEAEYRPYIALNSVEISEPNEINQNYIFKYIYKNSGKVTAVNLKTKYEVTIDGKEADTGIDKKKKGGLLNPGDKKVATLVLDKNNIEKVQTGEKEIIIKFIFEYEDIFDNKYKTVEETKMNRELGLEHVSSEFI